MAVETSARDVRVGAWTGEWMGMEVCVGCTCAYVCGCAAYGTGGLERAGEPGFGLELEYWATGEVE